MQQSQQTLNVAKNAQQFLTKLNKMRQTIRPHVLREIETIKKVTGVPRVRFEDLVFLKRAVREVLLAKDPNNIQVLKCFNLRNTLHGLTLLLKQVSSEPFKVTTVVLETETGEILSSKEGQFNLGELTKEETNSTVLITFEVEGRGKIILDLFTRRDDTNRFS